jgi:hypothetical protein
MCAWEYYGVATTLLKNDNLTASYPGQRQPYWSSTVFAISGVDMSSIFDPLLPVAEHCPSTGDCTVNFNTSGSSSDWIFVTSVENDAGCTVAVGGYRDWTLLTDNFGYSEVDYQVNGSATHSFSCPRGGGPVLEVADAVQAPPTNLLSNPGFETGNFNGWSQTGMIIRADAGSMHSGLYGAAPAYDRSTQYYSAFTLQQNLPSAMAGSSIARIQLWYRWGTTADSVQVLYTDGSYTQTNLPYVGSWTLVNAAFDSTKTVSGIKVVRTSSQGNNINLDDFVIQAAIVAYSGSPCGENPTPGSAVSTGSYPSKAGNLIVVVAGTMHGPAQFASSMVTDTLGDFYSLLVSNNYIGIWTATARSTGTNMLTFTNRALSTYYAICAEEYSHVSGLTIALANGGVSASPSIAIPDGAGSLMVGGFISWTTASATMPSPSVGRHSITNNNLNVLIGDVSFSYSDTLSATLSSSTNWYGAAIKLM